MNFHSATFGILLVLTLAAFWLARRWRGGRHAILLAASLVFYGWWSWWFLTLLAFSTVLDYVAGNVIATARTQRGRDLGLAASLVGNLGLLGFFKYWDWGVESLGIGARWLGFQPPLEPLGILVPVGISFYTFQTLSYTIDVYRGTLRPARSLLEFSVFVSFFPQLVAGPIVRAADFLPQMESEPRLDRSEMHAGLYRLGLGLAKKVLIADVLGRFLVDPVQANPGLYAPWVHLLAVYGFVFQIYGDFSGYSDIAIGTARLFGFKLLENFELPFQSLSVREFWRRWHISLSSWVRDYVYFPLGGSRRSEGRVALNLMVTFVVIGLWHGASVLWLIYGVMQGTAVCAERWLERRRGGGAFATTPVRKLLALLWTFNFTSLTLICVRSTSFGEAWGVLTRFGASSEIEVWGWLALAVAAGTHFTPRRLLDGLAGRLQALPTFAGGTVLGLVVGIVALVKLGDTPYIYFQF